MAADAAGQPRCPTPNQPEHRRDPQVSRLAVPIEGAPTVLVDTARGRLAVVEFEAASDRLPGPAPAVLCVPGYTGSKEDFGPVLPLLAAAGYRALGVDQRGQYESPGTAAPSDYTLAALAADVAALLDALALPAVHLVGHSFGGLVCRELVLAGPQRARSLTLLGSGPGAIGGDRARLIEAMRPLAARLDGPQAWAELSESLADTPFGRARYRSSNVDALVAMADTLLTAPDRTAELARAAAVAQLPVLVAHGTADDAWPAALQRAMATTVGARYATIERAGHSPAVEAPQATAKLLVDFLTAPAARL